MAFAERVEDVIRNAATWVPAQRWYGEKTREIAGVDLECAVPVDLQPGDAALAIARFAYTQGEDARYFIPLMDDRTGRAASLLDALGEPAFHAWLAAGFHDRRELGGAVTWRWRVLTDDSLHELTETPSRLMAAEQSNSSIVYGEMAVAKVFRRLQPGQNPDLEIGEFLARNQSFPYVPELLGTVELEAGGGSTSIAAVQRFVPNQGDGWTWLLTALEALDTTSWDALRTAVALLGRRTGELHVALAADGTAVAFAPVPFDDQDARELNERIVGELDGTVEGLVRYLSTDEIRVIHRGVGRLMSHAQDLVGTSRIRVHGDYHLGQVLRTRDEDFRIIDFEGEPSRPVEQRRRKQPALKDVAGMVRSLDYAVATVAARQPERTQVLRTWLGEASEAFVGAWRSAVSDAKVPLAPSDDLRFQQALELLIAEKALYEVRYELNNRPDWLSIPLDALKVLVRR